VHARCACNGPSGGASRPAAAAEADHVARLHLRGLLTPMRLQPLLATLLGHGADAQ